MFCLKSFHLKKLQMQNKHLSLFSAFLLWKIDLDQNGIRLRTEYASVFTFRHCWIYLLPENCIFIFFSKYFSPQKVGIQNNRTADPKALKREDRSTVRASTWQKKFFWVSPYDHHQWSVFIKTIMFTYLFHMYILMQRHMCTRQFLLCQIQGLCVSLAVLYV